MKVGGWQEEGATMGPVQNKMQFEKVKEYLTDSGAKGYKFATGSPEVAESNGYFIQPTIIDNPPHDSRIMAEEPFGPVLPVAPYKTYEEVIALANDTNTGLGGCVYGKDVAQATRIAEQIETGTVWINSFAKPTPQAAFGGVKESGIGAEWGKMGILSYCQFQSIITYK